MRRRLSTALLAALVILLAAFASSASALSVNASTTEVGWIAVHVSGAAAGTLTLAERRLGSPIDFATLPVAPSGTADLPRALAWSCDARVREIVATDAGGAASSASITTPSCGKRLDVRIRPTTARAGQKAVISVKDRWLLGDVSARACDVPAGLLGKDCNSMPLAAGGAWRQRSVLLKRPGRWNFKVSLPGATYKRSIKVRPRGGRLRVLATGDSMIQLVDIFLKQKLRRIEPVRLRSDAHISTGISKPQSLNWTRHAAGSARSFKPDVTVMFIGANDGFNMPTPSGGQALCCGETWVDEYARRVGSMMHDYERNQAGHVYWLLLPAPRQRSWRSTFRSVNQAILRAAEQSKTTHVVDLRRTFTPRGRYRQTIRWRGRTVNVRDADGVHLNTAGSRIAADIVVRRLRSDGVVVR